MRSYQQKFFLLKNLVKVDLILRHKKSLLNNLWFIITPLIYAALYYFAFEYALSARFGQSHTIFNMLILFWGVSLHTYMVDIMMKATTLIKYNINYVKKVVFPLELLCFRDVICGIVPLFFSILIGVIGFQFTSFSNLYLMLCVLTILPFILICLGMSLLISALGVFITDLTSLSGFFSSVLLFISPVLYNLNQLPTSFQFWFYLNPLTFPMQTLRNLLNNDFTFTTFWQHYSIYSLLAVLFFLLSYKLFLRLKKHFADVL